MKTNEAELRRFNACRDGYKRFLKQTHYTKNDVDIAGLVGGLNTYSDLLWLAGERLAKDRVVKFACDCALLHISKYKLDISEYGEKEYNDLIAWLKNPNADVDEFVLDTADIWTWCCAVIESDTPRDAAYFAAQECGEAINDCGDEAEKQINKLLIDMFNEVE